MNGHDEQLIFNTDNVSQWARFSGDFNPIHFSDEHARRSGLAGVVAHGMLVLIPIKIAASTFPLQNSTIGEFQFKAFFKKPVPVAAPVKMQLENRNGSAQFKLFSKAITGENAPQPYIRGAYGPLADFANAAWLTPDSHAGTWIAINRQTLQGRAAEYAEIPHSASGCAWAFLGTLVFSEYMRHSLDDDVAGWVGSLDSRSTNTTEKTSISWRHRHDLAVLQTSLCLRHSRRLHATAGIRIDQLGDIKWRRSAINATTSAQEVIGSICLDLILDDGTHASTPDLQIEISLIARKHPE